MNTTKRRMESPRTILQYNVTPTHRGFVTLLEGNWKREIKGSRNSLHREDDEKQLTENTERESEIKIFRFW